MPWQVLLAQYLAQQHQNAQTRQDKAADIHEQFAASTGYPTYGYQAAKFNQEQHRQNGAGLGMLGPVLMNAFGGGPSAGAAAGAPAAGGSAGSSQVASGAGLSGADSTSYQSPTSAGVGGDVFDTNEYWRTHPSAYGG